METTLFNSELCVREFKSHLLDVPALTKWLDKKSLRLVSNPPIENYKFVQVEALLCAIEREAGKLTDEEATHIVEADDSLRTDPSAKNFPRWLHSAELHQKWRSEIQQAVTDGELSLLDFGSKLPIKNTDTRAAKGKAGVDVSAKKEPLKKPAQTWWRAEYEILTMAQSAGDSLRRKGARTSNRTIGNAVALEIEQREKRGGKRKAPDGLTIKNADLLGWKYVAE